MKKLSLTCFSRLRSACISTLQPKLNHSSNIVASDSKNGHDLYILTLFVVKSAFHHRMLTIWLKPQSLKLNSYDRMLTEHRFFVNFWGLGPGLRDPSNKSCSNCRRRVRAVRVSKLETFTAHWIIRLTGTLRTTGRSHSDH